MRSPEGTARTTRFPLLQNGCRSVFPRHLHEGERSGGAGGGRERWHESVCKEGAYVRESASTHPRADTQSLSICIFERERGEGEKHNRKTEGSSGTGTPSSLRDSHSSGQLMLENSFASPPTPCMLPALLARSHLPLSAPRSCTYALPFSTPQPPLLRAPPPAAAPDVCLPPPSAPLDARPRWCGRV